MKSKSSAMVFILIIIVTLILFTVLCSRQSANIFRLLLLNININLWPLYLCKDMEEAKNQKVSWLIKQLKGRYKGCDDSKSISQW